MLAFLAAVLLAPIQSVAAPSAPSTPVLLETAEPWWEKVVVTFDDKGQQQSCRYETNAAGAKDCDKAMAESIRDRRAGHTGQRSKLTFERRFSPGGRLDSGRLQPGDTLLGRQVMFMTFDEKGAITSCKTVAASGDAAPDYDCDEIRKEQFRAQASADPTSRQAFMTVLAYGHTEQIA